MVSVRKAFGNTGGHAHEAPPLDCANTLLANKASSQSLVGGGRAVTFGCSFQALADHGGDTHFGPWTPALRRTDSRCVATSCPGDPCHALAPGPDWGEEPRWLPSVLQCQHRRCPHIPVTPGHAVGDGGHWLVGIAVGGAAAGGVHGVIGGWRRYGRQFPGEDGIPTLGTLAKDTPGTSHHHPPLDWYGLLSPSLDRTLKYLLA